MAAAASAGERITPALDGHADITRAAHGAGLVDRETNPLHAELLEQQQREPMGHGLDEHELGFTDELPNPAGHTQVIEGISDIVACCGPRAVDRQIQIKQHLLLDAAFPVDDANDALDLEPTQKHGVRFDRHGQLRSA